jgi:hypothetical protein
MCKGQRHIAPSRKLFWSQLALTKPSFREDFSLQDVFAPYKKQEKRLGYKSWQ